MSVVELDKKRKIDNCHENNKKFKSENDDVKLIDLENENLKNLETIFKANKLNFYLSKVLNGIDDKYNNENTLTIKEILSSKFGTLKESCQFNYLFDIDWLIEQYSDEFRKLPLTIIAQQKQHTIDELTSSCKSYTNISLSFAKLWDQWGTHHTKMMILVYEEGLRVIIHTCNLVAQDWGQKTQGIWCSRMLPRLKMNDKFIDKSPSKFQTDLIEYLEAYNLNVLKKFIAIIKRHDFSSVNVFLIGSIPGRHRETKLYQFGHLKLRKILSKFGPTEKTVNKDWPIISQFSSIGTLGKLSSNWLTSEFLDSLKSIKKTGLSNFEASPTLKIVFPTVENVKNSLEGYMAGASIPYNNQTAIKQPYLKNYMHQWKSNQNGRSKAQPHIKTYTRLSDKNDKIAWFLLTSANLSKAAWGCFEKNCSQLNIRSYELGVLFIPSYFGDFDTFKRSEDLSISGSDLNEEISLSLPFDIPLTPYTKQDQPWIIDLCYEDPDSHGNIWNPS